MTSQDIVIYILLALAALSFTAIAWDFWKGGDPWHNLRCARCGSENHWIRDCPWKRGPPGSPA